MVKPSSARSVRVRLKLRAWRRVPMRLLKWAKKMPSTKQYNLVPNDDFDTRIPLHPDEAFKYGITFHAKYIGSMEVPRPTSRVEIVAAMRRVRYEFKAKGAKKRKVTLDVSTEGVRVLVRKKKTKKKKDNARLFSELESSGCGGGSGGAEIMHHPIYRIFYVSHDSSDLKIFSYIARDATTNAFKCNVFKSNKKSQAMRIVRTVGQAFEVCHKQQAVAASEATAPSTSSVLEDSIAGPVHDAPTENDTFKSGAWSEEAASQCEGSESGAGAAAAAARAQGGGGDELARPTHLELLPPPPRKDERHSPQRIIPPPSINLPELPECVTKVEVSRKEGEEAETPLSAQHQLQLLRERLEQQAQQTRAAVAQLLLLRDQLAAEQAARCEAQARTHQLLVHNKELLEHIAALVAHLQEREKGCIKPISAHHLTLLPQNRVSDVSGSPEPLLQLASDQSRRNNNLPSTPSLAPSPLPYPLKPTPISNPSNEHIQNLLISKYQTISELDNDNYIAKTSPNYKQQFYQNSNAFPNIPPLRNHYSNTNIAGLNDSMYEMRPGGRTGVRGARAGAVPQSSPFSSSPADTSKDSSPSGGSSDEGTSFIMPLSHNGTLQATSEDGRVKLLVPVSPSGSAVDVPSSELGPRVPPPVGNTLLVPSQAAPILRTTSEKVPNRSEMMTALRSQWTRHTTK